jgi:hypothetical protein
MKQPSTVATVADEMLDAILAAPKKQRRLLSKTFWDRFGYAARTKERVTAVRKALADRHIRVVEPDLDRLGTEDRDSWIILAYYPDVAVGPAARRDSSHEPDASWFDMIERRAFESEREVEHYFVIPLLEALGYVEEDIFVGRPVVQHEGTIHHKTQADVVVYNGQSRDPGNSLLVIETKRAARELDNDAVSQARSYALWVNAPHYLVTNGDDLLVYALRGGLQDVKLLTVRRTELRRRWTELADLLSRAAIESRKARLAAQLD